MYGFAAVPQTLGLQPPLFYNGLLTTTPGQRFEHFCEFFMFLDAVSFRGTRRAGKAFPWQAGPLDPGADLPAVGDVTWSTE